ncbi:MAG: MtrB/PioB family outer membrane beta-barrel protein, partial [Opitutaceae bacterium]|nr:MtrB/PioB family outer membrane beta-barrel protein [Opitutaceae bacterium]
MNTNFRRAVPFAVSLVGLAWCHVAAASPLADTAVGTGTVLGNGMSGSVRAARPLDPDWTAVKRTPTGRMFDWPFLVPKAGEIGKLASGWEYSGQLEVGVIGGDADERNAQYRTYQDTENGGQINTFSFEMRRPESGHFVELSGGGAGRHDQYYGLQFGHANDWKVKVFFSETPHVFTDRYKSLWSGIGTGNLLLLSGLTAGGTASIPADNASVSSVATSVTPTTLGLVRKKGGVRVDANLWATWKVYAGYTMEKRKGARPFGAVWGNAPGTAPIEVAEPIDYVTHDFLAGLTHTDPLNVFNLRLSASIFENKISTLTFQEPYRIAPAPGVSTVPAAGAYTQGRFDLAPANQAYNARAEYTRSLPDFFKGHFTAVVSAGTWRQDDNLIPYTTVANLSLANVTVLPGGNWDSTGALSRTSTDATVDTRLLDLTLSLNPTPDLNVKARVRYHETKNTSDPYLAVNPNAVYVDADSAAAGAQTRGLTYDGVTGVWGRLLNDGSGQNLLFGANANAAGNLPIKNKLYGSEQLRFGPSAEYRLNAVSSLNASVEREIVSRESRQRDRTWEDKVKVGYVNRGLGESSLRVSYEAARRRGSTYVSSYYDDSFSAALVPIPTVAGANVTSWAVRMNTQMRALDIADRDQQVANVRFDTMLSPSLDAGISAQMRDARYPDSVYGRTAQNQHSVNLDLNYQP